MTILRLTRYVFALLSSCALCLGFLSTAQAGMQISPLQLTFAPNSRSTQIILRNSNATPLTVQVRVFAWSQPDSEMQLLPTTAITASPAIVTLAPGAMQLVRVLRREALPDDREHYFRVLVDELPDASAVSHSAVKVLTRYSLPVFVLPRLAGQMDLHATREQCRDGREFIVVRNTGTRRARLAEWQLESVLAPDEKAKPRILAQYNGLSGYALPGDILRIFVKSALPNAELHWRVKTDVKDWLTTLAVPAKASECAATP